MASEKQDIREIPLEDLVIGKGQVRTREVGKEIDELAYSIKKIGLLEPIVVCPSEAEPGKFEILTGQRRFLAHKKLQAKTILARVLDRQVDELQAKVISVTENLMRLDPNSRDLIDVCNYLYKQYGSVKDVAEETGLDPEKVKLYVKYARLRPEMKGLVDDGAIDLKVALKAQDAILAMGEYDASKATSLAKSMVKMTNTQRDKVAQVVVDNPEASVEQAVEVAKKPAQEIELKLLLLPVQANALKSFANEEGTNMSDAAVSLIHDGLSTKGFLEEGAL